MVQSHYAPPASAQSQVATEFISNQTVARCEERIALAAPRPTQPDLDHGSELMARYRVSEGHRLSHSEEVKVEVPTVPRPTFAVGYEGRMLEEGDEIELNDKDGQRLVDAGVLEPASKKRSRKKK